jgi:hypothetical protein
MYYYLRTSQLVQLVTESAVSITLHIAFPLCDLPRFEVDSV